MITSIAIKAIDPSGPFQTEFDITDSYLTPAEELDNWKLACIGTNDKLISAYLLVDGQTVAQLA